MHSAKSTTTVNVEKVGGGATLNAYSSDGINSNFIKPGQAKTKSRVGEEIVIRVKYADKGTSKSSPYGNWVY